jgi:hypothetical protein
VSGNQLGVETFGHVGKILEDTLDINHHGITGTGNYGKLLLHKRSYRGYAMALQYFIGRTADTAQLNPFGPF